MFGVTWNRRARKAYRQLQDAAIYGDMFKEYYFGHSGSWKRPQRSCGKVMSWNPTFCHLCQLHRAHFISDGNDHLCIEYWEERVYGALPPICAKCSASTLPRLKAECREFLVECETQLKELIIVCDVALIVVGYIAPAQIM